MIFFNFEVRLCKDLSVSGIEILYSCLYILVLLGYKQLAWFNNRCARYARTKFPRSTNSMISINFDTLERKELLSVGNEIFHAS